MINKKTLGTFLTRVIVMAGTLGVVLLNTQYLGVSGQGTASLINFGILLILAASNFIGGGALIYLVPRMKEGDAVWPSLVWAFISSLLFYILFRLFPIVPEEYILHTVLLGFLQSVFIFIQYVSLGREHIHRYNFTVIIQSVSGVTSLFIFFFFCEWYSSMAFVSSLYLSFSLAVLFAIYRERQYLQAANTLEIKKHTAEILRFGKYAQGGNILHLLNQRMNFIFLENMLPAGRLYTGMYSLVLYIAEGIWILSKSLSLVQYTRIANSNNESEHRQLTTRYLRLSLIAVILCCAVLVMIPDDFYRVIFGSDVIGLQQAVWWMTPGIIANGASIIYAHYFSGRGLHRHNAIASALGLIAGVITAFFFIPMLKVSGAAIAISSALIVQMIYFFTKYKDRRSGQRK
ncbi:MAG: polysaccharide biosynthesis C-terminal domain-containing protein [Crocinitomicaceae bacterium]|nr:polysaccharide biosynthesis C-terminal domain-containing protein [Crocinitomicaceae bacterium]